MKLTNVILRIKHYQRLFRNQKLAGLRFLAKKYVFNFFIGTKAHWTGTSISEQEFQRALVPKLAQPEAFLDYIKKRISTLFFIETAQKDGLLTAVRQIRPAAEQITVEAANNVCRYCFDLLGSNLTPLGDKIDWHVDFKTGHHYKPRQYYTNIRPAPYPGGHDIKVPWELSRCQHFVWLGQAYWFTGDERYAQEFVAQVMDWIERNPPQLGVNWTTAMDVAIRAVNWLWGYAFFQKSPSLTDEFILKFHSSLLAHGRHIRSNLEWSGTFTGNHYLSDIVGLFFLGVLCPQFREAAEWQAFALQELWQEMLEQVYSDGVNFEASISYHRLATELFLSAIVLCRLNDIPVPSTVLERLEKMLEFVQHYTRPDGSVPLIGDSDNGRLQRLKVWPSPEQEWIDHRYLLAIGAVLFDREDFGRAAGEEWEDAFWMWGERAVKFKKCLAQQAGPAAPPTSRAFPNGGIYILRDVDSYLIVDAGPNGQNGNGGHAHNDTLSFELYARGQAWLIDPGTYIYTADYQARNLFRSSDYHNALVVDNQEINRIDVERLFQLSNDAMPVIHLWETSPDGDLLVAGHTGYRRLKLPVSLQRTFWFDRQLNGWLIRDQVDAPAGHRFSLTLHFAPLEVGLEPDMIRVTASQAGLGISFLKLPPGARLELGAGWISRSYGQRLIAPSVRVSGAFQDRLEVVWWCYAYALQASPSAPEVRELGQQSLERLLGRVSARGA